MTTLLKSNAYDKIKVNVSKSDTITDNNIVYISGSQESDMMFDQLMHCFGDNSYTESETV